MRDRPIDPSLPVAELARRALEHADGSLEEAAKVLEQWARGRADIREALTGAFLGQACYQAVVAASWYERRVHWRPTGGVDTEHEAPNEGGCEGDFTEDPATSISPATA